MKALNTIRRKTAITGLALFLAAPAATAGILDILRGPAPAVNETEWRRVAFVGEARVLDVQGTAELMNRGRWQPLRKGAALREGDEIRTQPESRVTLQMRASGSLVRVTPSTILRLASMAPEWDQAVRTGRESKSGYAVRSVRGSAFQETGTAPHPVEVNMVLPENAIVRTEPGAALDLIHLATGEFVRIEGRARAELNQALTARRLHEAQELAAVSNPR